MIKKFNLLFVTMFGVGYIKYAPGTIASLIICIAFYIFFPLLMLSKNINWVILYFLFILLFLYSLYAISNVSKNFKSSDPKEIVIDECLGQMIPLGVIGYLFFPVNVEVLTQMTQKDFDLLMDKINDLRFIGDYTEAFLILLAFILFRTFDILKPFPINYIDKKIKNSFGIIFDDIIAGIFTAILIAIPLIYLN